MSSGSTQLQLEDPLQLSQGSPQCWFNSISFWIYPKSFLQSRFSKYYIAVVESGDTMIDKMS